ncbi:unnamed protein product [Dovyalis caffra]|uniref:Zinc-ribbon domain-containing protein n=1 Tax=Dovyalis caffra TaxID=77055 RepID=A0AAV1RJY8_9ROSI|nr:unnamed protein product [Dovyalis caffra]
MAEGSTKVRLVRCPKCENLLPELPDYSVYKCGGCGAVLRAKKKVTVNGGILEKSGMERDEEGFGKLESLSDKEGDVVGNASETEREGDRIKNNRRKGRILKERTVNFVNNPLSEAENKEALAANSNTDVMEQDMVCQSGAEKEKPLKHLVDNRIRRDDNGMNMNRSESVSSSREKGTREISAHFKSSAEFLRPAWGSDRESFGGGNLRTSVRRSKFPNFAYPDEGPSNHHLGSTSYGSSQPVKNYYNPDGPDNIAYLEQDRAELLRMLDELQQQLSRSGSMGEKQRERIPMDSKIAPRDPYCGRDTYNSLMLPLTPDKHVANPPCFKHYGRGLAPYMNSHDMDMQNFYIPSRNSPNEMLAYEDLYQQQTPRMRTHQPPGQYLRQPPCDNFAGQYVDVSHEPLVSYARESLHHRPACPCIHCYNNWHIPSQALPTTFGNRKSPNTSTDSNFNHHVNSVTYGLPLYHPQANPPALSSRDPHVIWPSDVESDMDGFPQSHSRKVVIARGNKRLCRLIAGGAPFISCYNCFELLKLPRKLEVKEKNQQKLRCGACSALILLEIENKRLVTSVPAENKKILVRADGASHEVSKEVFLKSDGCLNAGATNCPDDFDNPGHDFQSADLKDVLSEEQKLNSSKHEKRQGLTSSSSSSSEEEENLDGMAVQKDFSYADEPPIKDEVPSTFQSSPSREHSGDVLSSHAENKCEKGNTVGWTEQENVILEKNISRQTSVKDVSMATEVEVPFNEYLHTSVSQDSVEVSKEEDQLRNNKGSEPFLVGLIKKSFRDFSRFNQHVHNEKPDILINGKPISDRMVKRAEKLAGPIQPGDYWLVSAFPRILFVALLVDATLCS